MKFSKFATAGRRKKLVLSMLSIIYFNRVNGLEQLISAQHTHHFVQISQRYTADDLYWKRTQ